MSERRSLVAVAILAVSARVAVLMAFLPVTGLRRQEPSAIAANVNAGLGFVYPQYGTMYYAFKEPGHVALLALLARWFGDRDLPVLVLQWTCALLLVLVVTILARRLTGDRQAAVFAGALVAINPFLLYYDSLIIHPLSLDMLLFAGTTVVNVWAADDARHRWSRAALAGLITGIALWQRSLLLCGGVGLWAVAVLLARGARSRQLTRATLWACVAVAVVAPWFVRNHAVTGRWLFTTDSAHILWLGNNPLSNGTYSDAAGERVYYHAAPAFRARIEGRPEVEQMEVFLDAVRTFVREHPAWAAALVVRKLWAFVWFASNTGAEYRGWQIALYVVWYIALLVLGVAGAATVWRGGDVARRRRTLLVGGTVLGLAALHAVAAINMKHRVPLEIVLSVFAAAYVTCAIRHARGLDAVR